MSVLQTPGADTAASNDLSSKELADAVLDTLGGGDSPNKLQGIQGEKLMEMLGSMGEFIQNERFVLDLSAFLHNNNTALNITLQPAYLDVSQRVQRCVVQEMHKTPN